MEDPAEVQERETEVLKAIYGDDFEKAESKTAWKSVNAVHEYRICIRPVEEELKEVVHVWLRFKLPKKYPKTAPTITTEDATGLSAAHLSQLLSSLQKAASSRLGDEMVFDLCTQAATFITERHQDSIRGSHTSLEDQRRKRAEQQTKATLEASDRARALKEKQEAEEAARLSQLISEDVRRKEDLRLERERKERERDEELDHAVIEVGPGGERHVKVMLGEGRKEKAVIKFGLASSGDWLGRIFPVEIARQDKPAEAGSAYVFDVLGSYFLTSQGKRKLGKIEADFDRTLALRHPHLLSLLGYRIVRYNPAFFPPNPSSQPAARSGEGWSILILTSPLTRSQSLEDLLSTVGELRTDRALTYFTELVSAVEHLHSQNVVHRGIKLRSVFVTSEKQSEGSGEKAGVRLVGAGWSRRLMDLNKAEAWVVQPADEELPDSWTAPEVLNAPFSYDRSRDLFELGIVLAQMVFGAEVHLKYPSPADLVRNLPRGSPPILKRVLSDLLLLEAKKRPNAQRLAALLATESSSGMGASDPAPMLLSTTPPNPLSGWHHLQANHPTPHAVPLISPPPSVPLSRALDAAPSGFFWQPRTTVSRYRSEFEELEFLGKGGGGQVVKARNRLDGHLYAIKKVKLPSDPVAADKLLREVLVLSRMNHPHVVKYHTAWISEEEDPAHSSSPFSPQLGSPRPGQTGSTFDTDIGTGTEDLETDGSSALRTESSDRSEQNEEEEEEESTEGNSTSNSESDETDSAVDFDEDSGTPGAELDIEFGMDDFDSVDFLSVGHAHSRSVSYPSIHFGDDDDDDGEAEGQGQSAEGESTSEASRSRSRGRNGNGKAELKERSKKGHWLRGRREQMKGTPSGTPGKRQTRTLYIQMEYVEKLTLREAIDDGLSEIDSWRLLFQILSAMLHFTSLNIIHRDLKPSNIFLDVKGDVRIGDFGLAVNQGAESSSNDVFLSLENSMDESDLTSGVGTSLYIAPEMLARGRNDRSVKYSNKIDMYSFGVTLFEMAHPPFATGMERIHVLHDLRKPDIRFPASWDKSKLARQTKIIQACLEHSPELRPSPKDLLASDLLPPRVGDDSIQETLRLLSHSGTTYAQTLITALFSQSSEDRQRKDFSYDFTDQAKVDNDPYSQLVHDKLGRIFRQKGAVQMDSPLLMPHSQVYAARKPVRLLDTDGTIVCLPFQLNIPFCRMVARDTSMTRLKRWTIAPVFRPSPVGGQPRAVLNAAFDIVSDAVMPAMEAECIFVIEEILAAFPLTGQPIHILNHSKVLDALMDVIPSKQRPAVCEILVQHGRLQRSWVKTSTELLKLPGVTRSVCDILGVLDVSGDLAKMRSLVLSITLRLKHLVQEGFDELRDIIALCRQLGVKNIKVAPLLATNYDLHRDGAIFESHVQRGKIRDVIAAGGRFDEVVSRLATPEVRFSGRVPHLVGFSLAVSKLSLAAAEANALSNKQLMGKAEHLRSYGQWAIRRCDVYVVSFSAGLIDLRLEIVKELWSAGLKADLMYDDDFLTLTPEQLVNACRREGILWLVIVKPSAAGRAVDESVKSLKVKSVLRGYEEEVPRAELSSWLIKEMREQSIVDEATGGGNTDYHHPLTEQLSALPEPPKPMQDYVPILADDDVRQKGRHNKRTMIAHRAQKNIELAVKEAGDAPVFAVDVEGLAFEKLANSPVWVTNDDAFKTLLHTAPLGKRDYYIAIRQTIQKYRANRGCNRFWLFSLRDDRSVLMSWFDPSLK
ncbi:hypothetical protein JCM11641_003551 [Rhodosporidiobolus odoratus]